MFDPTVKASNEAVLEGLLSSDPFLYKEATNSVDDYLRIRAYEDGIFRKIMPPITVTQKDLDRQVDTVKPVIVKDMEPEMTAAYSMPFGGVPGNTYMNAPRYRVMFDRIVSPRFMADVNDLLTFDVDLKKVFNEIMLKKILYQEDTIFLTTADAQLGAENSTTTTRYTDVAAKGYINLGGFSRAAFTLLTQGLASTNRSLESKTVLMNNVTAKNFNAFTRDYAGGDKSESWLINGFSEEQVMGHKLITTIKKDIVANNIAYVFADPKYVGDFMVLNDVTVYTKTETWWFFMHAYECLGGTLKNTAAFAKGSFSGTARSWT